MCKYAGVAQRQSSGIVNRGLSVQIRSPAPKKGLRFFAETFLLCERCKDVAIIKNILKKYGKVALKEKYPLFLSIFFIEKHKFRQYVESMHKIAGFV